MRWCPISADLLLLYSVKAKIDGCLALGQLVLVLNRFKPRLPTSLGRYCSAFDPSWSFLPFSTIIYRVSLQLLKVCNGQVLNSH